MTIKEANNLISILRAEINQGKDVEFNKEWVRLLSISISKALENIKFIF